jgi:ABC-type polysaccharide/polyol phosphate transport system ATPase subunit
MNNTAIIARNLSKIYKLYATPRHRIYDVFGLKDLAAKGASEHRALNNVSFEVARGEKVAIIGRNGAGKSTLLKLITRVIQPTSGELIVGGETRALLSLGTGFHPELTGRQNAEAYLASLGFGDTELKRMVEDAIAFAEIEEYADQPIKTYSTGMGVRLMFSTATMMIPDLLVIDEVLGAGDAYFQHKSFERIRELCGASRTTLVLVTHDVYSAAELCSRMIWIDKGRILIDADPAIVLAAYNDSIRAQEERRLRVKALGNARGHGMISANRRVLVELRAVANHPLASPVFIAGITLLINGVTVATARLDDASAEGEGHLVTEGSAWGEAVQHEGRLARPFRNWGSNFHKVAVAFDVPLRDDQLEQLSIQLVSWTERPSPVHVVLHSHDFERELGVLSPTPNQWVHQLLDGAEPDDPGPGPKEAANENPAQAAKSETTTVPETLAPTDAEAPERKSDGSIVLCTGTAVAPALVASATLSVHPDAADSVRGESAEGHNGAQPRAPTDDRETLAPTTEATMWRAGRGGPHDGKNVNAVAAEVNTTGIYGTGDIIFHALQCFDSLGRERHVLDFAMPVTFRLSYTVNSPNFNEKVHLVLAFKRDGVTDMWRLFARDVALPTNPERRGSIDCPLARLPLGVGHYSIVLLVARNGYYDSKQTVFFSMNPEVYFANVNIHEIRVEGATQLYANTGSVTETHWHDARPA